MSITMDIGTLIVRTRNIRGGRPRMTGTGVTVARIAGWYRLGLQAEEIADRIGHVSVGQVYAALAYYHANREEIDADLTSEDATTRCLERERPKPPAAAH